MTSRIRYWLPLAALIALMAVLAWFFLSPSPQERADPSNSLGRPLRVGIVSWPGYAGGLVANGGFKPNPNSIYSQKYGQPVEFILLEDVDARAKAFARGDVDIVWTTVDFWANELPGFIESGVPAKVIMQVDWSRGGDAVVADRRIQRLEDLRGKKLALALLTPSQWLLENALQSSSLSESEITTIIRSAVAKNASPDARSDFVAGRVDAAVVWEPDVSESLRQRPGSHLLLSSRDPRYQRLLADCMVARQEFIDRHPQAIRAFVRGWLDGTAVANRDHDLVVRLLMENEPLYRSLGENETRAGLATVRWADLQDNTEMFGLDGRRPLFDDLFTRASQLWVKRRAITKPVTPSDAVDTRFLRELTAQ